jgi:hypothetical protein
MMARIRWIAFVIIAALMLYVICLYRVRMLASVWHVRNGQTLTFDNYVVPVPTNWYPVAVGDENELLVRLDTDNSGRHKNRNPHASILLFSGKPLDATQIRTLFSREEAFSKGKGADERALRTVDMGGGETIFCIGGNQVDSGGAYEVNPTGWHCKATSGLEISLSASVADLPQTWDVVTHIRKK